MADEQVVPDKTVPPAQSVQSRKEARAEMLEKVRKARESRMRHQNPDRDAEDKAQPPRRNDKGYSGRPVQGGNAKSGTQARKKDHA